MWRQPEAAEMLGECDRCHDHPCELYQIDDDPGAWLYCWKCAVMLTDYFHRRRPTVGRERFPRSTALGNAAHVAGGGQ